MDQQPEKRKYAAGPTVGPSPAPIDTEDASSKRRRVIGPSLPPPAQSSASDDETNNHHHHHHHKASAPIRENNSESDSSDDDFGPTLPPPAGSVQPTPTTSTTTSSSSTTTSKPEPQRDAWMLEPLEPSDRTARVDPTRLRNRRFQSGPRAGHAGAAGGGVDVTWTETPEQKMKRLQDEVLGVQAPRNHDAGAAAAGGKQTQPSKAMQEQIRRYNEEKRREDAAAREKHRTLPKEEEDDPSKRAFDREKDMGLAGKISHAQRREMISKAADFGSRFSSGRFL